MKLIWKLFFSYLVVLLVVGGVIVLMTSYIAPVEFSRQMQGMGMMGQGQGDGQGNRWGQQNNENSSDTDDTENTDHSRPMMGMMEAMIADYNEGLNEDLNESVRQSVNQALLIASITALIAAILVSYVISQRITKPIRELGQASQRIAAGHYDEKLDLDNYSNDELGEFIRNFNRMAELLAKTEGMRQQLIGDVSHELKTPLTGINAYMEGLQDGVLLVNQETFQQIQREVRRLQRLVQDLQQLSRAEAGKLEMKMENCDAKAIVQSAIDWIQPQFEEKNIHLSVHLPDERVPVRGDFDRISQVLLNLLGNALHYTPEGGQVTLNLEKESQKVLFALQDTGIGLSAEDKAHIFQRFYRVDKSRSRNHTDSSGSGIGLTISRHIVENMGGEIQVESPGLNQGSTFYFHLSTA